MKRIVTVLAAGFFAVIVCGAQNSTDLSNFRQEGIASWYGMEFDGRPTASGEIFNSSLYTAAHPTLPFGTLLTITNMNNDRKVNVRVNDRGPFVPSRIIDLSHAAAQMLDMVNSGTAPVVVEIMKTGPAYSQGTGGTYQAEANTNAVSQGGYTSATSQVIAPYPSYQAPVYQNPPVQSGEPGVAQQPNQYYQQSPAQNPRQPVQSVQPIQQVIQPVQPVVQPQQPSRPAAQTPAAPQVQNPSSPIQTTQPIQIHIPIEVWPAVSSKPVVIPEPKAEPEAPVSPPAATGRAPTTTAPAATGRTPTTTAPAATGRTPTVPATVSPAAAVPVVAAPSNPAQAVRASTAVIKPNTMYRIQVGSYREVRNALTATERLKNAGLNPAYERNGELFRVVLPEIPSKDVSGVLQTLTNNGFAEPLLREEQ
ncbi:MAG: septal ring lytic transglycosylase RlpA family protein [Treponema sp.]|nr:septal ring lytic transglycosylase RlpA family protein [Treponema sp.]